MAVYCDRCREWGELTRFYPGDLMETGSDLLRPWVARMIMFGLYRTGTIPFKHVYIRYGTRRKGQKMSKQGQCHQSMDTLGDYGSDALAWASSPSVVLVKIKLFSTASVIAGRNFCNKLWIWLVISKARPVICRIVRRILLLPLIIG